jgi:hypothetical protein
MKKPRLVDDPASPDFVLPVFESAFEVGVVERTSALLSESPELVADWCNQNLPAHVREALQHLPREVGIRFLTKEIERRLRELEHEALSHPAIAMRAKLGRAKAGKVSEQRSIAPLDRWAMDLVSSTAGKKKDAGIVADIQAKAIERGVPVPEKARVLRAIREVLDRPRRRGRPKRATQ